jgi:uncharacterized BrkB/YihY/UPF0761 family membrane protein
MNVQTPGSFVFFALRIPFVLLLIALFFLLGKSSLNLISAYAVPFGFSPITTAVFSVLAVIFFAGIGIFFCLYLFRPAEKDH